MIVVIAIFLGLQVDGWNEVRKFRQDELIYLDKVLIDLLAMRTDLVDKIERNETNTERMTAALYALEDCDSSAEAETNIKYTLEHYQVSNPINYLDATYTEMVQSGALARMRDLVKKQKITYTFSALRQLNARLRDFRISMPNVDTIVWKNVFYSVDRDTGRVSVTFGIAEICDNIELRNAFVEMIDIQHDGRNLANRALTSVDDLTSLLQADTAKAAN
ncbi:MAG: hypothetical protein IIA11_08170 [Proteobacteria bacterium]|nr:hypothetical protein [Pseudomonadota bacterium]